LLKLYQTIIFSLFFPIGVLALDADTLIIPADSSIIIDVIEIRGNDQTEEYIILREMTVKAGDTVNSGLIEFNRERVYSLGLFNFVNTHLETKDRNNILVISVEEGWYIWPLPFWFIREKDLSKSTFGLNLIKRHMAIG